MLNMIIDEINKIQSYDELQTRAEELLVSPDLDDVILQAIEKRQDELYTPTAKDIAEKNLREGIKKQGKNTSVKQARKNKELWKAYKNVSQSKES